MPPVNLHSDTQTRPSQGMRAAIAAAEVGDEQRHADPTTRLLEERVASLLGHEAAVFLPSGTMCNEIALRLHVRPGGDELILDRTAHPVTAEAGGPAQLAGAMVRTLDGEGGIFTVEQLDTVREPQDKGRRVIDGEDHDVGVHRGRVDAYAGQLREPARQRFGVLVIVGQAFDVVLERVQAACRDDPGLA